MKKLSITTFALLSIFAISMNAQAAENMSAAKCQLGCTTSKCQNVDEAVKCWGACTNANTVKNCRVAGLKNGMILLSDAMNKVNEAAAKADPSKPDSIKALKDAKAKLEKNISNYVTLLMPNALAAFTVTPAALASGPAPSCTVGCTSNACGKVDVALKCVSGCKVDQVKNCRASGITSARAALSYLMDKADDSARKVDPLNEASVGNLKTDMNNLAGALSNLATLVS